MWGIFVTAHFKNASLRLLLEQLKLGRNGMARPLCQQFNSFITMNLSELCLALQQDLMDLAGNNYPAFRRQDHGLLSAAVSDINTAGVVPPKLATTRDGKNHKMVVQYWQPGLESDTSDEAANVCTEEGITETKLFDEITISHFRRSPVITFTKAEMRDFCDSTSAFRAQVISKNMDAFMQMINKDLIAIYNTGVGKFYNDVAAGKNLPLLIAGPPEYAYAKGESVLMEDYRDVGGTGTPIVVGAGKLATYSNYQKIGCCNQYGQDITQLGQYRYFRDHSVGGVTGNADDFFMFAPGAIQFVSYNTNVGEFAMADERSIEGTIVDPITGLTLDFELNYDRCDKVFKMMFFLNFDLYMLPNDMFPTGDARELVNYSFRYRATAV